VGITANFDKLKQLSLKYNISDLALLEKQSKAFLLLNLLRRSNADFIFKGGTSLLLLLDKPHRFSIDIDILMESEADSEEIFNSIIKSGHFTGYEYDNRKTAGRIKKNHLKFYYNSALPFISKPGYVLLDIVYADNPYSELKKVPLISDLLLESDNVPELITLPGVNSILGDKLTAFAPNTTGIPLMKSGKLMGLEIVKQITDINALFDKADDLQEIRHAFGNTVTTQLFYRHKEDLGISDVTDDIRKCCFDICIQNNHSEVYPVVLNGIKQITSFLINMRFSLNEIKIACSKTAYLSSALEADIDRLDKFTSPAGFEKIKIIDYRFSKLNKLKKILPEAFYYWHKALQLRGIE